jgi:hypothetical protein
LLFVSESDTSDTRGVKQADVVMLGFPLLWSMPDDVRQNDLIHYETVTNPNGPAMTWGIFSTGWLDLGNFSTADQLFNKSYASYAHEPFKVTINANRLFEDNNHLMLVSLACIVANVSWSEVICTFATTKYY